MLLKADLTYKDPARVWMKIAAIALGVVAGLATLAQGWSVWLLIAQLALCLALSIDNVTFRREARFYRELSEHVVAEFAGKQLDDDLKKFVGDPRTDLKGVPKKISQIIDDAVNTELDT